MRTVAQILKDDGAKWRDTYTDGVHTWQVLASGDGTRRLGDLAAPHTEVNEDLVDVVVIPNLRRVPTKRKIRVAPVLWCLNQDPSYPPRFRVSDEMYASEEQARDMHQPGFVRWLVDTPYALEVEVDA